MGATMSETVERHAFGAEVGRLLDLVVHSLYTEREIFLLFLRELVANAADAVDRRRFEALANLGLTLPADAKVRILPDKAARTLTISDPGIGMAKADLAQNLGTIARSGTLAFARSLAEAQAADRAEAGTDVVLHLKADAEEFLEPFRLQAVVRKWADHITVPITIAREGKDEPANEGTALWRKPKAEVSQESYTEFYRHLGHLFDEPWATLHWRAEGALDFAALLFVPGSKPFQALEGGRESRV